MIGIIVIIVGIIIGFGMMSISIDRNDWWMIGGLIIMIVGLISGLYIEEWDSLQLREEAFIHCGEQNMTIGVHEIIRVDNKATGIKFNCSTSVKEKPDPEPKYYFMINRTK